MSNSTEEFRSFLEDWFTRTGWSQNQLALEAGVGQGLISRWVHPDPRRRTTPSPDTLRKIAPTVGKSYEELMVIAGWWPRETKKGTSAPQETDPPELLATWSEIRAAFYNAADKPDERAMMLEMVRRMVHVPRRQGRPREERRRKPSSSSSGSDEGVDKTNSHNRKHNLVSIT